MSIRNLTTALGLMFVCCLAFSLNGCDGSATEDIFGSGDDAASLGAASEDSADESGDDESNDENPDADPCDGVDDGAMVDSVDVPAGETCTLNGTTVVGDVTLGVGSSLVANGVSVGGDISSVGGAAVTVSGASEILGNIGIAQTGDSVVEQSFIGGTIQLKQNTGAMTVSFNTVREDLQVFENTGGVSLISNQITNQLTCSGNIPAPTGSGNNAAEKLDQCAGL